MEKNIKIKIIEVDGEKYMLTENKYHILADCELCELCGYCDKRDLYYEPAPCLNKENYYFKKID